MASRDLELAWAGGFLEGEGFFQLRQRSASTQSFIMGANQVNPEPLERLKILFGGTISHRKKYDVIRGGAKKPRQAWSGWELGRKEAVLKATAELLPWLSDSRQQRIPWLAEARRYVTADAPDPVRSEPARLDSIAYGPSATWPVDEPRYRLMRLCQCDHCDGEGKVLEPARTPEEPSHRIRCQNCRGEGKTLDEIARCDTPADIGVALVTFAAEGEFDGCPFGLIDDQGEPGLKWLVRPWVASPRNVSDAARTLAKSKGDKT